MFTKNIIQCKGAQNWSSRCSAPVLLSYFTPYFINIAINVKSFYDVTCLKNVIGVIRWVVGRMVVVASEVSRRVVGRMVVVEREVSRRVVGRMVVVAREVSRRVISV